DREQGGFRYHQGPVFTQLLLADEINRATPKTQSALLETMEERQVSHEGKAYALPSPHYVIATQNPQEQQGTYPLPESQLDRFLMRLSLGYPKPEIELALLRRGGRKLDDLPIEPVLSAQMLVSMVGQVAKVEAADAVLAYIQRLLAFTRESAMLTQGISPRGGLALLNAAQAWAFMDGRNYVLPDDVQAVAKPVLAHRIKLSHPSMTDRQWVGSMLSDVDVLG
ncbi:MAG: AAA family ATPase, partial [Pontibacterium sp.]